MQTWLDAGVDIVIIKSERCDAGGRGRPGTRGQPAERGQPVPSRAASLLGQGSLPIAGPAHGALTPAAQNINRRTHRAQPASAAVSGPIVSPTRSLVLSLRPAMPPRGSRTRGHSSPTVQRAAR